MASPPDDPIILGIETSHDPGSVALALSGDIMEVPFPPGLVHGRELLPRIDTLFNQAGVERRDLEAVAVSAGPGSYTGIRIGVSGAKALAWALGIPALALSSMEVIAANVTEEREFAVILDARRGNCYGARFRRRGTTLERLSADVCVPPAEFLETLSPEISLVGAGTATLDTSGHPQLDASLDIPRAAQLCDRARQRIRAIRAGTEPPPREYGDPHTLLPFYLRVSEAEERSTERRSTE